jgi:WD40 repeat protein
VRGCLTRVLCAVVAFAAVPARAQEKEPPERMRERRALLPEGEPESLLQQARFASMGSVGAVAFSHDGSLLASGERDGTVRLWEVATGHELRRLKGHKDSVQAVAFSRDGRRLASGGESGWVGLWDVETGRELWLREVGTAAVQSLAFAADGQLLASGGRTGRVQLWKTVDGKRGKAVEARASSMLIFSPDGQLLASGGRDQPMQLWKVDPQGELQPLERASEALESFSEEPGVLAAFESALPPDMKEQGSSPAVQSVYKQPAPLMAFSPGGQVLASGGSDSTISLRNVRTGWELRRLDEAPSTAQALAFSKDGRLLASGGSDGGLRLWEVTSGRLLHHLEGNASPVRSLAFSPDGSTLASGGANGLVHGWDARTGHERWLVQGSQGEVLALAFSQDGTHLTAARPRGLSNWQLDTRRVRGWPLPQPSRELSCVSLGPDGSTLALGDKNGKVHLWRKEEPFATPLLGEHVGSVLSVAFSPDGQTLASSGADGKVVLWDVRSLKPLSSPMELPKPVRVVAFSPNGRVLAAGGDSNTVHLWELRTGKPLQPPLKGHTDSVWALAFSADGQTLASGGNDRRVLLWRVGNGRLQRSPLEGHTDRVTSLAFSPTGLNLASGDADGVIRLWSPLSDRPFLGALRGARQGWLSQLQGQAVFRHDDGRFLYHPWEDGALQPVPPQVPDSPPRLSATSRLEVPAGELGQVGWLVLEIRGEPGGGAAHWVRVEPAEPLPPGLLLLPPAPLQRIEAGGQEPKLIRVGLSYSSPGGAPLSEKSPRLRLKLVHASGEEPLEAIPLELQAPELSVLPSLHVKDEGLTLTLQNTGNQATGPIDLVGLFRSARPGVGSFEDKKPDVNLAPGEERKITFDARRELLDAGRFSFTVTAHYRQWPRSWTWTAHDVKASIPYGLYVSLGMGALLLFGFVYYARIYRNPMVVQAARSPSALKAWPLSHMVAADQALRRAHRLDSTITAAGIPLTRWERALCGARDTQEAAAAFAEAVGGRLGASLGSSAWAVTLPTLRLRFARDSAVVVVDGTRLESGAAERRMADVFQDGRGPRQVLVLDRTLAQNARQVLEGVPRVRCVVLSADRLRDVLLADEPGRLLETTIAEQIAVSELSPYQVAGGVKLENLFFGREREVRAIADRSMRNFLVVGQRQMGKSSLLLAVLRRLQAHPDLEARYVELADADVHRRIARERERVPAEGAPLPPFVEVAAGEPSRPRVWLIDEADDFIAADTKAGYPVLQAMRALAEEGRAYFILAGFWELYRAVVLDEKQPLRNFGEHLRLEPLDERAALALVTEPMAALGLRWDAPSTPGFLLEQAGRRANLLVLACKALVESLPPDTHALTREHLERVLREDKDLRDQGRRWRGDHPLHRAVVRQALLLGRPMREEVRRALKARGADIRSTDFDEAMDHRELSYVLVPDGEGRLDCPVPLMQRYIESERGLEAGLAEDLEDLRRRGLSEVPRPV